MNQRRQLSISPRREMRKPSQSVIRVTTARVYSGPTRSKANGLVSEKKRPTGMTEANHVLLQTRVGEKSVKTSRKHK